MLHRIRPIIENLFDKNGKNKSAVSNNRALAVRYLTENAFYYVVSAPQAVTSSVSAPPPILGPLFRAALLGIVALKTQL